MADTNVFEKTLQTRILLKYATYDEWMTSTLTLKKGEAAICEVQNNTSPIQNAPTILVKYGDDNHVFKDLPWSSALAADVYVWAKESGLYVEEVAANPLHSSNDTTIKVLTAVEWKKTTAHPNGALVFTYDNAATLESIEEYKDVVSIGFENFDPNDPTYSKEYPYNEFFKDQSIDLTLRTKDKDGNEVSSNSLKFNAKEGIAFRTLEDTDGNISGIDIIAEKHSHNFYHTDNELKLEIRDQHAQLVDNKLLFKAGDNISITSESSANPTLHADKHITTLSKNDSSDNIFTLEVDTATTSNHTTTQNYKLGIDTNELTKLIGETTTAAMEFKGVTATVPTGTINHGDMWKIVADATVTVSKEQDAQGVGFTAKTGDAIVAKVDGNNVTWYLIPAGDDVEDTWRPVYIDGAKLDTEKDLIFCNDHGNVQFAFCEDGEISANVEIPAIPDLKVTADGTTSATNGLTSVVTALEENPEHEIKYKTIDNVATSGYVTDEINKLDSSVTATNANPSTYTVKNAAGTTQTITPPVFGTGVTQTDGKLTAMTGAQITTDDILQGQYVLVLDCGGAN